MNTAELYVSVHWQGRQQWVQALHARESLNAPLWAQVHMAPLPGMSPQGLMGVAMSVRLPGRDGGVRHLHGQVCSIDAGEQWVLTIRSRLWQGHLLQKSRLFLELNRRQLVQQLLDEIGYARDQIDWRIDQPSHDGLPPAPLLQAAESHLDCFNRLLSEAGWNYWFEDIGQGRECLVISDRRYHAPLSVPAMSLPSPSVSQSTGSHGVGDINQLVRIGFEAQLPTQDVSHSCELRGPRYQRSGQGHWQSFVPPLPPEAANRRVKSLRNAVHSPVEHELVTHQPRLQVGQTLAITPGALPLGHPALAERVLLLSIEHQAVQPHTYQPGLLKYHNVARVCDAQRAPSPTPLTLPKAHPLVLPATISGSPGQPQPDRDGQYLFTSFTAEDVRSRYPGLLLRPYAQEQSGWHFPLLGGTQVLITFLNGNPNHPLILGVLPHVNAPGPVNANNATQHRLVTPAHNELTLDDDPLAPCIRLQSLSHDLQLELNAKDGEPFLRLAAQHGAISLQAAQKLYLKAAQHSRTKIKADRSTQVTNQHTSSAQGSRHWQSAQHLHANAKQNHQQKAGNSVQLQSGQDLHITAQNNMTVTSAQGQQIRVPQGSLITRSQGNLTIEGNGQGDLILGNDKAGIKLDAQGRIKLYGKAIQLNGSDVKFKGPVNYASGGSNQPEALPQVDAAMIAGINKLLPLDHPESEPVAHDRLVKLVGRNGAPIANRHYLFVHSKTGEKRTGITDEHGLTDILESETRAEKYTIYLIKDEQNA